jgi:hypothetical protein
MPAGTGTSPEGEPPSLVVGSSRRLQPGDLLAAPAAGRSTTSTASIVRGTSSSPASPWSVYGTPMGTSTGSSASRPETDVVTVNVGGRRFTTTMSTLCMVPDSALAAMVTHWKTRDAEGNIFLDRDPAAFGAVLACLRTPGLSIEAAAASAGASTALVSAEIRYLGLDSYLGCQDVTTPAEGQMCDVQQRLGKACAETVKQMVDSEFAAVAGPVLAKSSGLRPQPGAYPTAPIWADPSREGETSEAVDPRRLFVNVSWLSHCTTTMQQLGTIPAMLPGECVVGATSTSNRAGNNTHYNFVIVTNMCRISRCKACYTNGPCDGGKWTPWRGDPYPMTEEYVRLAGSMPGAGGFGPGPAHPDDLGQSWYNDTRRQEAEVAAKTAPVEGSIHFFERMIETYKAFHLR